MLFYPPMRRPRAAPCRKITQFVWDSKCTEAFEDLKTATARATILTYPAFERDFYLFTDASDIGLEAVLTRKEIESIAYALPAPLGDSMTPKPAAIRLIRNV